MLMHHGTSAYAAKRLTEAVLINRTCSAVRTVTSSSEQRWLQIRFQDKEPTKVDATQR